MVCAASYEARAFGIRSAMPSMTAGRLCPQGIFIRPRLDHYRQESRCIMQCLVETGALIEQTSIDESISNETTFLQDTEDRALLKAILRDQAAEIAAELKQKQLMAKTVHVRVRYGDFTTLTRQLTTDDPFAETKEIYRLGCYLLAGHKLVVRPLRLLGLGVSNLGPPSQQLLLHL